MSFRQNKKSSGPTFSIVFLGICVIFAGFLVYENAKLFAKRSELHKRTKHLQAEIARLTKEGLRLQAGIAESETPEYKEKILREQGLYQKPGEEIITVLPPKTEAKVEGPQTKKAWWDPRSWFFQ